MEKNGKILVVDDSIMITSQVERILKFGNNGIKNCP